MFLLTIVSALCYTFVLYIYLLGDGLPADMKRQLILYLVSFLFLFFFKCLFSSHNVKIFSKDLFSNYKKCHSYMLVSCNIVKNVILNSCIYICKECCVYHQDSLSLQCPMADLQLYFEAQQMTVHVEIVNKRCSCEKGQSLFS